MRRHHPPIMPALPGPTYENLRMDAQLSLAVGGATGVFVGTDLSYGAENWMGPLIGVTDDDVRCLPTPAPMAWLPRRLLPSRACPAPAREPSNAPLHSVLLC